MKTLVKLNASGTGIENMSEIISLRELPKLINITFTGKIRDY